MRVADILKAKGSSPVRSAHASDTLRQAVQQLYQNRIGALVVLDDTDKVVGIISERDVVRGLAEDGGDVLDERVETLMSRSLYICKPTDDLKDVLGWMTQHRIRHLPVVDAGQLRGMISIGDAVKHRLIEMQTEANVLRDIIISSH